MKHKKENNNDLKLNSGKYNKENGNIQCNR